MESVLLEEMITILFPTSASIIISILWGISLYKYLYSKYLSAYYYDDDIKFKLFIFICICSFVFCITTSIEPGNYSEHISLYFIPDLKESFVMLKLISFLVRIVVSAVFDLVLTVLLWNVFKTKFLE